MTTNVSLTPTPQLTRSRYSFNSMNANEPSLRSGSELLVSAKLLLRRCSESPPRRGPTAPRPLASLVSSPSLCCARDGYFRWRCTPEHRRIEPWRSFRQAILCLPCVGGQIRQGLARELDGKETRGRDPHLCLSSTILSSMPPTCFKYLRLVSPLLRGGALRREL